MATVAPAQFIRIARFNIDNQLLAIYTSVNDKFYNGSATASQRGRENIPVAVATATTAPFIIIGH